MAKLDTDYGTFKDLISVARIYTVPQYQRRYSWTVHKQVTELWADIVRIYRQRQDGAGPDGTHFIGSLVVGETEARALGPGYCSVIDGQQRLTTLSILIAALRDALVEDAAMQQEVTDNYLCFANSTQTRLVLSQADHSNYEALVFGDEVGDRRSPIYQTYIYFLKELTRGPIDEPDPEIAGDSDDENLQELSVSDASEGEDNPAEETADTSTAGDGGAATWDWELLLRVISQDLELVSIAGVPAERAYQIFATLNHSGMRLTQTDLIRNAVFMNLPTMNTAAYAKIWRPLEDRLGERGLPRFLHAWVVRRGYNVPQKDTYASMLTIMKREGASEQGVYQLLQELGQESDLFLLINDPSAYESQKLFAQLSVPAQMANALRFLATWGSVPAQPLLLEVMLRWQRGQLSPAAAVRVLAMVESFVVRRFIALVPPNDLRSTLARLLQQVRDASSKAFEAAVKDALLEPPRRWPSDSDVVDALVTRPIYRGTATRQTFLILKRLAEDLEGKECPQIELGTTESKYSIEHILPQSVEGTGWLNDLDAWGDVDPHLTWHTRRHTIGNLTLTAYNSELSNSTFDIKKEWIASKLRLNLSTEVLAESRWTKDEIEARSEHLADRVCQVWPYSK